MVHFPIDQSNEPSDLYEEKSSLSANLFNKSYMYRVSSKSNVKSNFFLYISPLSLCINISNNTPTSRTSSNGENKKFPFNLNKKNPMHQISSQSNRKSEFFESLVTCGVKSSFPVHLSKNPPIHQIIKRGIFLFGSLS